MSVMGRLFEGGTRKARMADVDDIAAAAEVGGDMVRDGVRGGSGAGWG